MRSFRAVACVLAVAVLTPRISLASNPFVYQMVKDQLQLGSTTLTVGGDGRVYGTTALAGPSGSVSTVFRIDGPGALSTLHTFVADEGAPKTLGSPPRGFPPSVALALVLGTDGALYGVTNHAATGASITCCTLFRVATAGTYTSSVVPMPSGLISQLVRGGDGAFYAAL